MERFEEKLLLQLQPQKTEDDYWRFIMKFDIFLLIKDLSEKCKLFVSEADFQLELAWIIKQKYPDAVVKLEYCPEFDESMHIDILVIIDKKWVPIELKYKTKKLQTIVEGEYYNLKNHSAKDVNCYAYLKDIQRIETIKNNVSSFKEGYAILLTNDLSYTKPPRSEHVNYYEFSIHNDCIKHGILDWGKNTGEGTKGKNYKSPIELAGTYKMVWNDYIKLDTTTNSEKFQILINRVV